MQSVSSPITTVPEKENQPRNVVKPAESPMFPLERVVIEYCIKYGFLELCSVMTDENDDGDEYSISVLDYVAEELEADSQSFSVDIFAKIFELLKAMRNDYAVALENFSAKLNEDIEKRRKSGIDNIASSDMSVMEIERAEKKLEEELDSYRNETLIEFSKDYPGRQLASHEDGEVRNMVTELIRERHQLSHIYMRDNNVVERDEDRLGVLVPRAMTEWKGELLNLRLKELFTRFHDISGKGDSEAESKLMMEMNALMRLRSQVAKDIGERILSPRSKK